MVEFTADKVKLAGPKTDGTITVSLDVGEYMAERLAPILTMRDTNIAVILKPLYEDRR